MKRTVTPLNATDDAILRCIYLLRLVSAEQICTRFYSPGSLAYARLKLKHLADAGFLVRFKLPNVQNGNTPWLYMVGRGGENYLKAGGVTEFVASHHSGPGELQKHWLFAYHTLAVNDFLIAAMQLPSIGEGYKLDEIRSEWMMKKHPAKVKLQREGKDETESVTVCPDAWIDFHKNHLRQSIALEMDMATEEEHSFKHKIRALLAFAAGPYMGLFGSTTLRIAFATPKGSERVGKMKTWCEQVLTADHKTEMAAHFCFAAIPSGRLDAKTTFLQPIWHQPFSSSHLSLLAL